MGETSNKIITKDSEDVSEETLDNDKLANSGAKWLKKTSLKRQEV